MKGKNIRKWMEGEIVKETAQGIRRLKEMQGPERRLVSGPRSGEEPEGVEGRSREASGVSGTVVATPCPDPNCVDGYTWITKLDGMPYRVLCDCGGAGERSGPGND